MSARFVAGIHRCKSVDWPCVIDNQGSRLMLISDPQDTADEFNLDPSKSGLGMFNWHGCWPA